MTKPASSPIESILETSQEFNEAAERAAQILVRLDQQLTESGIGTAVYYEGGNLNTDEAGKTFHHHLGFDRVGSEWCITVERWRRDEEGNVRDENVFPLRTASRMLRLHFIEHVPALLVLLQGEAEKQRALLKDRLAVLDSLEAIVARPQVKPSLRDSLVRVAMAVNTPPAPGSKAPTIAEAVRRVQRENQSVEPWSAKSLHEMEKSKKK